MNNDLENATAWIDDAVTGWISANAGEWEDALNWYRSADRRAEAYPPPWNATTLQPDLCLLRHRKGIAPKVLPRSSPFNEDQLIGVEFRTPYTEEATTQGLVETKFTQEKLVRNIEKYQRPHDYHLENITAQLPHLMVLSTGRCGTVSLYRLLESTRYVPYHSYPFQVSPGERHQMMCEFIAGEYSHYSDTAWARTRAAEWLGPMAHNRPMAAVNHMDTIFAPVFAAIHPCSTFIYLYRDPEKIFKSFYGKDQFNESHLLPMYYAHNPFRYKLTGWDLPEKLAWYIRFTEVFARAFGEIMGDRFIEISADKLFRIDEDEIHRLTTFIDHEDQVEVGNHFMRPYNQKLHKDRYDWNKGIDQFWRCYESLL